MKKLVFVLPIMAGVLWGSVGIFVRVLQEFGMDRSTVLSSKLTVASIMLFIGILVYKREWLRIKLKDLWIFLVSGIFGMLFLNLCINEAIRMVTLSFAAVLLSLSPIFVIMTAAVLFKEKITKRKILCTLAAILGCVFVSGVFEKGISAASPVLGIILGLAAALFYAMYGVFSKMATKKGYNVFTVTFYSIFIAGVMIIPFTKWSVIGDFIVAEPVKNSVVLLLFALCTSVLPYVFYTIGMAKGDAGKVSLLAAGGEPVAAMVFGAIFFSEMPTVLNLAGLVITVTALTFICMPENDCEDNRCKKEGSS